MIIKFKKGDRVRALQDSYSHYRGEVGVVDEDDSDCPYVRWDNTQTDATPQENLAFEGEPRTQKFRKGDKVVAIVTTDWVRKGSEGIVDENAFNPYVLWSDGNRYAIHDKDIELISKKTPELNYQIY